MAHPKVHAVPTGMLAIISLVVYTPLALLSHNTLILALVLFFGIFMDGDHLSIRRIKKILRAEKGPVEGWVNWIHTWHALAGVIVASFLISSWLPFLSYASHILIDGANRSNLSYPKAAPLPTFIHRFYPQWLKYETGLII